MNLKDQPIKNLEGKIVRCEECGCDYFYPIYVLKKVSRLMTGLSKDKIVPLQAFRCAECGHINRDWDPLENK